MFGPSGETQRARLAWRRRRLPTMDMCAAAVLNDAHLGISPAAIRGGLDKPLPSVIPPAAYNGGRGREPQSPALYLLPECCYQSLGCRQPLRAEPGTSVFLFFVAMFLV